MLFIPGIGFASIDGPTFYLLVQYFDRRRELANSVLVSSVSFGGLAPFISLFFGCLRSSWYHAYRVRTHAQCGGSSRTAETATFFSVLYPKAMFFKSLKLTSILQFHRAKSAPHLWVKECYLEMVYQHLLKRKQHGLVCQIGWMLLENEMALVSLKVCRI